MNNYILLVINIVFSLINLIFLLSLSVFLVNLASSLDSFKNDVEDYLTMKMNKPKPIQDQESGLMDV